MYNYFQNELLISLLFRVYKTSEHCENAHQRVQMVKHSKEAPEEPKAGWFPSNWSIDDCIDDYLWKQRPLDLHAGERQSVCGETRPLHPDWACRWNQ